ncbi:MAG: BCCT family transporter [Pseudomonadota bacterium]
MSLSARALIWMSLGVIAAVAAWGVLDPAGMVATASEMVTQQFNSRAWFVMLTVTGMLVFCVWLAFSRYGTIRLGADTDRPEFSTISWLTMLFSAGMGVGLLFWASAEPLTHFRLMQPLLGDAEAAYQAQFVTNFHWGLHAWAIYAATALVIAYFTFRRGTPMLVGAPFTAVFGQERWAHIVAWLANFLAIVAIAIGVGGSIAMGVFQVADGIDLLAGGEGAGDLLVLIVFLALFASYIPALLVDLGDGMARLSNLAMATAGFLLVYVIVTGPTQYMMNSILEGVGAYLVEFFQRGFLTYTFFEPATTSWFQDWTLTYMVWWLAWGPFVGVFVARISRGRTIREFVAGVLIGPVAFSLVWFGTFGGIGLFEALRGSGELLALTETAVERVTFVLLDKLPLGLLTTLLTIVAAFLFIVTSVVSAAFVLGSFTLGGTPDPSVRIKLVWGVLLGFLGYAMILSGSIDAIKKVIALGAMPFVFITVLLLVCLVRALGQEGRHADR